jgi:hypothetical protein
MRKLTSKFPNRPGVRRIAVENFLSTLGELSFVEALGNLTLDAGLYRWNEATCKAIYDGILVHFYLKSLN